MDSRREGGEKEKGGLANADRMREVMRVQDALQDRPCARQTDAPELLAQEVDGAAVERVERVSARHGALFHERFLRREQGGVELALRRGERAVCGKGPCCIVYTGWSVEMENEIGLMDVKMSPIHAGFCSQMSEA